MIRRLNEPRKIHEKMYGDERDKKLKLISRCYQCKSLFSGFDNDSICGKCEKCVKK